MKKFIFSRSTLYIPAIFFALIIFSGCKDTGVNAATKTASEVQEDEDMGGKPWVLDIEESSIENSDYRKVKWTGENMQMVLMSLRPDEVIDLEMHDHLDQFLRLEQGQARVLMGKDKNDLSYDRTVTDDWAVFVPAGYYHEIRNTGDTELKLYTIYSPAEHPRATVNSTYEEAKKYHEEHEDHNGH